MAKILFRPNPEAIERIRVTTEALKLTDKDKAGPLRIELESVHVKQVNKAFKTRGVSTGRAWPAWKPGYAAWRAKNPGFGKTMMQLSKPWQGRPAKELRRAFTLPGHPKSIGKFKKPFSFIFGASDDVAFKHEHGIGPLPRRSIINKTPKDIKQFVRTLLSFWDKRIEQATRHA